MFTNHQALKFILGLNSNIPTLVHLRLQRYAVTLSAYNYNIYYKKCIEMQMLMGYQGYQ